MTSPVPMAASANVTRRQITVGVLMSCGARDFVSDDEVGLLYFRVGPGSGSRGRVCKIKVQLMSTDTYTVTYGYLDMRLRSKTFGQWIEVEQETDVYAEDLPTVVRRLGDRERY